MRVVNRARRWLRGGLRTWYDPGYRLPISSLLPRTGFDPRRADLAAWHLLDSGALRESDLVTPLPASYADLALVHTPDWLERLHDPQVLGAVFAVDAWDCPVDEVLRTLRLVVGGTLAAARAAVRADSAMLNLAGGFHHAGPNGGAGFCPVNDVAVAIARLRRDGFEGRVAVLDLDAHPPDGTALCLERDPSAWIGSISGSDWGPLPAGVDETILPEGADDEAYLSALDALLERMPAADLCFVLAGGDPLAGDRFGTLGLTLDGLRQRDLAVADRLEGRASVWLPAGGYTEHAWRVLAGTALALALGSERPIPAGTDPLRRHFAALSSRISDADLSGGDWLDAEDLEVELGLRAPRRPRLLGFYTAGGLENALERFGLLTDLRRLGYDRFRVWLGQAGGGECFRLHGWAAGKEHVLVECVLDRRRVGDEEFLLVNWLTLRHPLAVFSDLRPQLPGQDVPGLGLVREATEMLNRVAARLGLAGLALQPSWYHVAYAARGEFHFADPERQGRFEALVRDLADLSLLDATRAVADGKVLLDGVPYEWEASLMVDRVEEVPLDRERIDAEASRRRFSLEVT